MFGDDPFCAGRGGGNCEETRALASEELEGVKLPEVMAGSKITDVSIKNILLLVILGFGAYALWEFLVRPMVLGETGTNYSITGTSEGAKPVTTDNPEINVSVSSANDLGIFKSQFSGAQPADPIALASQITDKAPFVPKAAYVVAPRQPMPKPIARGAEASASPAP